MTAKESIEVQEEPEGEPAEPEQEACATISFFTAARYPKISIGNQHVNTLSQDSPVDGKSIRPLSEGLKAYIKLC